jgi:hypothetical protein
VTGSLEVVDTVMRLALKAQSQSRSTIETLAEIKNPSHVAFVKQANISNGPQQVNNGPARAENVQPPPNKLLEQVNGERLEFGAACPAVGVNSPLAAVGAINGTAHPGRKVQSFT